MSFIRLGNEPCSSSKVFVPFQGKHHRLNNEVSDEALYHPETNVISLINLDIKDNIIFKKMQEYGLLMLYIFLQMLWGLVIATIYEINSCLGTVKTLSQILIQIQNEENKKLQEKIDELQIQKEDNTKATRGN